MPNKQDFINWWNENIHLFADADLTGHLGISFLNPEEKIPFYEKLKAQIMNEAYLGVVHENPQISNSDLAMSQQYNDKYRMIITATRKFNVEESIKNLQLDTGAIASELAYTPENPQDPNAINEDGYFKYTYSGLDGLTEEQIRLSLLEVFVTLAQNAIQFEEGAVFSLIYISNNTAYILNAGDAPVYVWDPEKRSTNIVSRRHDFTDFYERDSFFKRGGKTKNETSKRSYASHSHHQYSILRALGDHVDGIAVPGMLHYPTLSVVKYPKNGRILACSDGISKVFDPKDISYVANLAEDSDVNIANTIVQHARNVARDDTTAIDVPAINGTLVAIIDGHSVSKKLVKNKVVASIENELGPLFIQTVKKITNSSIIPTHTEMDLNYLIHECRRLNKTLFEDEFAKLESKSHSDEAKLIILENICNSIAKNASNYSMEFLEFTKHLLESAKINGYAGAKSLKPFFTQLSQSNSNNSSEGTPQGSPAKNTASQLKPPSPPKI